MPRIDAPSVRENRTRRSADLRRAARELVIASGPATLSMADAALTAGLSRSAAYEYFPTREALLAAIVTDELRVWAIGVSDACASETSPSAVIETFVDTSVELMQTGQVSPRVLAGITWLTGGPLAEVEVITSHVSSHLRDALAHSGVEHPDLTTRLLLTLVIEAGSAAHQGVPHAATVARHLIAAGVHCLAQPRTHGDGP